MIPISPWNNRQRAAHPGAGRGRSGSTEHDGFTLLEVMIAVCLLAIALPTLFGSQSQSVSLGSITKFNTLAPLLAQRKLAEISSTAERPTSDNGDFGAEFPEFHWKMELDDAKLESSEILSKLKDIQKLTLTVTWGDTHSTYTLESYLLTTTKP